MKEATVATLFVGSLVAYGVINHPKSTVKQDLRDFIKRTVNKKHNDDENLASDDTKAIIVNNVVNQTQILKNNSVSNNNNMLFKIYSTVNSSFVNNSNSNKILFQNIIMNMNKNTNNDTNTKNNISTTLNYSYHPWM